MSSVGDKKIVFVLGAHRSGTSLTAELVSGLGYFVPGDPLDTIDKVNERGFWESKNVVALNERLLDAAQLKWFHVCPVGHFFKSISHDALRDISAEIKEFIEVELHKHGRLVIKDPRLCILLPVWLSVIDQRLCDVKIIFVGRHPAAVASSLQARDGFSLFSGHLLWLYYFFSVLSRGEKESIFYLSYEHMMSDPHSCGAMLQFLGVAEVDGGSWLNSVDARLQRNFSWDFPDRGYIYNLAKDTHAICKHGAIIGDEALILDAADSFDRFLFENNDFVYALNESNNNISELRGNLVSIGDMHTYALQVIAEKDELLHENVSKVLERDERLAVLQASLQQEEENTNELRQSIRCCDAYIAECEARVFDLEFALNEFMALRGRIENLEGLLIQRNAEALHNEAYIARMDSRIAELHQAMLEFDALRNRIAEIEAMLLEKAAEIDKKTRAVQGAEDRVIELDELFVAQRSNYLSALSVIDDLEKKITSRNDEFFFVVDELSDVRGRLDNLLTWRIVRLVDRYVSKGVGRND